MKSRKKGSKAVPKPLPIEVDYEEFTAILDKVDKMHHKVAFLLGWGSGMRISEIVDLRREDIDMAKKEIRINMGKNSKDRIVPLAKGFRERHLQYIPMPCKQRALQKAFITYATEAGVVKRKPKIHFHSLRHGFATHCLRKGIPLPHIQLMLGHEDLSTTSIYLNLCPEEAKEQYQDKF